MMAISLAQKANLDAMQRNVILRKYGDFLYQKGDYDTAMQQYLKAIENTEPSQVIRKVGSCSIPWRVGITNLTSFWTLNGYIT